ncbi:alpha/beta hydrolase [Propionivibrio sp.]|uniref:alpha/beta hydrolase n=1 Tax=Propionivibrio sp. TaxID=2212460 RepID=UPI003BF36E0B
MTSRVSGLVMPLSIVVLLFVGGVAMFQDDLIYFPENPPLAAVLADARRHDLTAWPGEDDYRGLLREAAGPARGTLVLFHGNAGQAVHREWYASELTRLGLRVILAEYPAYGARAGKLGEAALVADAAETLAQARRQFPGPLLLAGESLGAGVAAAVAKSAKVDAVLLITPWDRIESIAHHHYPWLPVGLIMRDRYDSVANLSGYNGRVAVIIAEHDSIVPPNFGHRLFESLSEPKQLWIVPAADHNDWMGHVDAAWWQSVIGFLIGS